MMEKRMVSMKKVTSTVVYVIFQKEMQSFKIKRCVVSILDETVHSRSRSVSINSLLAVLWRRKKIASTQNVDQIAGSMEVDKLFTIFYKIE